MHRVPSAGLPSRVGERVSIAGWVHRRRVLKSVTFLILRDAAGLAQVVVTRPALRAQVAALTEESGTATLPTMLDHAALSLRHPSRRDAFRISAAAVSGFRSTLDEAGFVEVHTPKIVGSATESGATVFPVDYFGRPAYLAQSPQFYKQALVGVFERVYEVGPVFRAEPHDTVRHLAQYTSLDVELGFIADHRDVMAVLRDVLAGMVAAIGARAADAIQSPRGPSTPTPIRTGHHTPAASTCSFAAWSWSAGASGCTAMRTTSKRWHSEASRWTRISPMWRSSGGESRRTAASPSGSNGS